MSLTSGIPLWVDALALASVMLPVAGLAWWITKLVGYSRILKKEQESEARRRVKNARANLHHAASMIIGGRDLGGYYEGLIRLHRGQMRDWDHYA